jgi:hypothetical protein
MFKKIIIIVVLTAVVGLLIFGAVNRTLAKTGESGSDLVGSGYANEESRQGRGGLGGHGSENGTENLLPAAASGDLDANEIAALLYMREEEKLAHDVYLMLSAQWGLPIFENISQSEQSHTDSVKALIDRYDQTDPASNTVGVLTDPNLQDLYNTLIARGNQSLRDALEVGAAIEEIDILDLENYLSQIDNADIRQVFTNLLNGSYNHLSAFTKTLAQQEGVTYQPQYLSVDAYQAIVGTETGGRGRAGAGGGSHGNRP